LNDSQALAIVNKILSMIPPPETKSMMDQVLSLIANNSADVADLIDKVGGIQKFFEILPDLIKIGNALKG
jgi:threonine dehydrogenase-like Zn-dependent dehydrogenase